MNYIRVLHVILLPSFLLSSCLDGPGFFKQDSSVTSPAIEVVPDFEEDGIIKAKVDANSNITQLVSASSDSEVSGSSISLPPGSLAVATEITLEEGTNLATASMSTELGLSNNSLSGASNPLVITSSEEIDAVQPFTLAIPIGLELNLAESLDNLAVLYKVKKMDQGGKMVSGVYPKNKIEIKDGAAYFETKYFGSYQLVYTETVIEKEKEVETDTPILTKAVEKKMTPISWSAITASYDEPSRKLSVSATVTGLGALTQCTAIFDQDKATPYEHIEETSSPIFDLEIPSDIDGTYYTQIECMDINGRIGTSSWSDGLVLHATTTSSGTLGPSELNGVNLTVKDTISADLEWIYPPDSENDRVFVIYYIGDNNIPSSCVDGVEYTNPFTATITNTGEKLGSLYFDFLNPDTTYNFRICSINNAGLLSKGITATITTPALVNICDTGSLAKGQTCIITSQKGDTSSDLNISGPGSIKIQSTGTDNGQLVGEKVNIHVGGDVTIDDSIASYNAIKGNIYIKANNFYLCPANNSGCMMYGLSADGFGYEGGSSGATPTDGLAPNDPSGNPQSGGKTFGSTQGGSGGQHAGFGGSTDINFMTENTFGSYSEPSKGGAGGGGGSGSTGGNGGGEIRLEIKNEAKILGTISAQGSFSPSVAAGSSAGGGGAGGSIFIKAQTITLEGMTNGALNAKGGDAGDAETLALAGGGGSGGRIALLADSITGVNSSNIFISGGKPVGGAYPGLGSYYGGHGTLYLEETSKRELWVGGEISATEPGNITPIDFSNNNLTDIVLLEGSHVRPIITGSTPINISTDNLTIKSSALLDLEGLGYAGGAAGKDGEDSSSDASAGAGKASTSGNGGGGGHGGAGGDGTITSTGGTGGMCISTGSTTLGPSGAGGYGGTNAIGGDGGGAIKIMVTNTFTLDGTISANGSYGHYDSGYGGGGGAGGSIWITAKTFAGSSGTLEVKGGDGSLYAGGYYGGGGGGGCIRTEDLNSNETFNLPYTFSANGGYGQNPGAQGNILGNGI